MWHTASVSIALIRQIFEHENITEELYSGSAVSYAKLDLMLLNKTAEKNVVFKDFDVLFLKCSD